jgi:molybdopterin converting factor subunit 1
MKITVQLFARARDLARAPRLELEVRESATVGDLKSALVEDRPELGRIAQSLLVAINGDYAADSSRVPPDAEVACFPPVSGG